MKNLKTILFFVLITVFVACGSAEKPTKNDEKANSTKDTTKKSEKKLDKKSETKEDKSAPTNDEPQEKEVDKSVE